MAVFKRWNGTSWEIIGPTISNSRVNTVEELIAPEYDSNSAYSVGDFVVYSDTLYKCNTAIGSSGELWNSAHWTETKIGDEVSDLKSALNDNLLYELVGDLYLNATWANGNISAAGTISHSEVYAHQVITEEAICFPVDVKLMAKDAYKFTLKTFTGPVINSNNQIQNYGNVQTFTVPANTYIGLIIKNRSGSDPMPVEAGSKAVYIETISNKISASIQDINDNITEMKKNTTGIWGDSLYNEFYLSPQNAIENQYMSITQTGDVISNGSAVGVSNLYTCKAGDVLSGKLSTVTGSLILAVYDYNEALTYSIIGTGYSGITDINYTFTDEDRYFRVAGAISRVSEYSLSYNELPPVIQNQEERITALEDGIDIDLPEYWRTYMDSKIPEIQQEDYSLGKNGISFIFITDTHIPRNSLYSPYLIKNILKNTNVRFVINGGDTLDVDVTKQAAVNRYYLWRKLMYGVREYCVIGNHDLNTISQTVEEAKLNRNEFYSMMFREHEEDVTFDRDDYYVLDYPSQKIRFIIVSTGFSATNNQGVWLKTKMTELDATWSVIIVTHYFWKDPTTLHNGGEQLIAAINDVYDNLNATFICVIAGHAHADISMTEGTKGYLIIATTSDARTSESGNPRTAGTTNEHAFDVVYVNKTARSIKMIRIGSGDNRNFSY